ncbi:hypothetical protein ACQP2U_42530 (plasmid) [Nocardia sp. CA-084685]|uniref:hypothetical protein n=1 Tax=Nocardia sp. CA-084685 TaxID=3239970 RepID=UPI003D99E0BC
MPLRLMIRLHHARHASAIGSGALRWRIYRAAAKSSKSRTRAVLPRHVGRWRRRAAAAISAAMLVLYLVAGAAVSIVFTVTTPAWWAAIAAAAVVVTGLLCVVYRPRMLWHGNADAGAALVLWRRPVGGGVSVQGFMRWPLTDASREAAVELGADLVEMALATGTVLVARVEVPALVARYELAGFRSPTMAERRALRFSHPMGLVFLPTEHTAELPRTIRAIIDGTLLHAETVAFPVAPDRAAYVRHGFDPSTDTIAVDLGSVTQDDRDLLAVYLEQVSQPHYGGKRRVAVTAPTTAELLEALHARHAAEREWREQRDHDRAERIDCARAIVDERRTTTRTKVVTYEGQTMSYEILVPDCLDLDQTGFVLGEPDIAEAAGAGEWLSELAAENSRRQAAAHTALQQRVTRERAEKDAVVEVMRQWAQKCGSEGLQMQVQHGTWLAACEKEWQLAHGPADFHFLLPGQSVAGDVPAPTATDLEALQAVRQICDGTTVSDPRLARIREANGRKSQSYTAVGVAITAPTGKRRILWRSTAV